MSSSDNWVIWIPFWVRHKCSWSTFKTNIEKNSGTDNERKKSAHLHDTCRVSITLCNQVVDIFNYSELSSSSSDGSAPSTLYESGEISDKFFGRTPSKDSPKYGKRLRNSSTLQQYANPFSKTNRFKLPIQPYSSHTSLHSLSTSCSTGKLEVMKAIPLFLLSL